jgi:hypothetical protein
MLGMLAIAAIAAAFAAVLDSTVTSSEGVATRLRFRSFFPPRTALVAWCGCKCWVRCIPLSALRLFDVLVFGPVRESVRAREDLLFFQNGEGGGDGRLEAECELLMSVTAIMVGASLDTFCGGG